MTHAPQNSDASVRLDSSHSPAQIATRCFVDFFQKNPIQFGTGDIICLGTVDLPTRIAQLLLLILLGVRDANGADPIREYLIVIPPSPDTHSDYERDIRERLAAAIQSHRGTPLPQDETNILRNRIRVQRAQTLEVRDTIRSLASVEAQSIVVICNCALYRDADIAASQHGKRHPGALLEEDVWVANVHLLASEGVALAAQSNSYFIFDVGENYPSRAANRQRLMEVDPCGLAGINSSGGLADLLAARVDQWVHQVAGGRSDLAMAEIDALPDNLARYKPRIKAQLLFQAGRHTDAVDIIRSMNATESSFDPHQQAQFARFAIAGGDHPLARQLLLACLPRLERQESLEQALSVALSLRATDLEEECLRRLESIFPTSADLRQRRVWHFLHNSQTLGRGQPLVPTIAHQPVDVVELKKAFLQATSAQQNPPAYTEFLASTQKNTPTLLGIAQLACGIHAWERGWPELTLAFVMPSALTSTEYATYAADLLLQAIERVLITRSQDFDPETLIPPVTELARYLGLNPSDASRRVMLAELLAVQSAGEIGLPVTLFATLALSGHGPEQVTVETLKPQINDEMFQRIFRAIAQWANDHGPLDLGQVRLPSQMLEGSADGFISRLKVMAEIAGNHQDGNSDLKFLEQITVLAALAAPHASQSRNDDLEILRFAAGRFALAGRHQKARDFAEQALHLTGSDRLRARLAWYTFADVYHRVNNLPEALLGMSCALACDVPITPEQAWYETNGLIRLFRDIGLIEYALKLVPRARELLQQLNKEEKYGHRLETVVLNLRILSLKSAPAAAAEVSSIVQAAVQNYRRVRAARDEIEPVAMLLAQGRHLCEAFGLPVEPAHSAALDEALGLVAADLAEWIRTTSSQTPSPGSVLKIAQSLSAARYAEDLGFDLRATVMTCERLLSGNDCLEQPEIAAFAIEMMADHAVTNPAGNAAPDAQGRRWLVRNIGDAADAARQLSSNGVIVTLLGMDAKHQLIRVSCRQSTLESAVREAPSTFSIDRFQRWCEQYPYEYGVVDDLGNLFYTSQQGIGTTLTLEGPTVLVAATSLQVIPPNLLLANDELAGRTTAMAAAPSLSWLTAIRGVTHPPNRPWRAWIPTTMDDDERRGTLAMVAERLETCLLDYNIPLNTQAQLPNDLNNCGLAVVVAHGRIGPDGIYFQSVADDDALRMSPLALARALAQTHLVILFVCSAGRTDKHPFSSTALGLPKELLDRNCSAVVASPWPLDARVPSHWLPAFLREWTAGIPLVEASFRANKAVERAMGDSPALCLAMNVYGDPLARCDREAQS